MDKLAGLDALHPDELKEVGSMLMLHEFHHHSRYGSESTRYFVRMPVMPLLMLYRGRLLHQVGRLPSARQRSCHGERWEQVARSVTGILTLLTIELQTTCSSAL